MVGEEKTCSIVVATYVAVSCVRAYVARKISPRRVPELGPVPLVVAEEQKSGSQAVESIEKPEVKPKRPS